MTSAIRMAAAVFSAPLFCACTPSVQPETPMPPAVPQNPEPNKPARLVRPVPEEAPVAKISEVNLSRPFSRLPL